jgi:glycosidase
VRFRPYFVLAFWLSCALGASWAQAPRVQAPRIDKIDPPGWWASFPDPMLLVYGEGLNHARITVDGTDVKLDHTQISDNGHWAFLWLKTADAAPQILWVTVTNDQGQARRAFPLAERSQDANAHAGFSSADALYLVMTDRFADGNPAKETQGYDRAAKKGRHGGDFAGIEQHLDYLSELGITALWTTPVASNGDMSESYHGYAATDLYTVDSHFGTLEDYQHLSDALHDRHIKLVIDLVPNHIGVKHPWVLDPPAPDWLHGTLANHRLTQSNFYALVDPHAPREAWSAITDGWFTDAMPDLNQENPLVARYLIQNALWWVETANIDGIRLDTFPYVDRAFWHDFHATLHSVYPHLTTVGEIMNGDAEVTSFFAGGVAQREIDSGLDTPFDYPLHYALCDVLAQDKPMTDLAKVLRQDSLYPHPERLVPFIGNHDRARFLTEVHGSVPRLKLAVGLLLSMRGVPQLYSGDEIGMTGGDDPDNRHDFPGGFTGDTHNAFIKANRTATEEEIFGWTSGLLKMRASYPALQTGIEQNLFADENVFAFVRSPDGTGCAPDQHIDRLLIVVNKGAQSDIVDLPMDETALAGCTKFQAAGPTTGATPVVSDGKLHIEEPAASMTIFDVH